MLEQSWGKEVIQEPMHKQEFQRQVAKETRLSQRIVADVLNASHRLIEETLRAKQSVTFPGFGTFYTSERKGGKVIHVRTGEEVSYKGRRIAQFRAGEILKRAVRGDRRRK
jgi:DNA-binding protein HU-beta